MGVQIEFMSASTIADLSGSKKVDFLLKSIKGNKIIVIDEQLTPQEERELITETMKRVSSKFPGIEVSSLGTDSDALKTFLIKMLGGRVGGLTVIGPSNLVKEIKRDPNKIRLLATSK